MTTGAGSVGLDLKYRIFIFNLVLVFAVLGIATWFELDRLNDAAGDHVTRESQRPRAYGKRQSIVRRSGAMDRAYR